MVIIRSVGGVGFTSIIIISNVIGGVYLGCLFRKNWGAYSLSGFKEKIKTSSHEFWETLNFTVFIVIIIIIKVAIIFRVVDYWFGRGAYNFGYLFSLNNLFCCCCLRIVLALISNTLVSIEMYFVILELKFGVKSFFGKFFVMVKRNFEVNSKPNDLYYMRYFNYCWY